MHICLLFILKGFAPCRRPLNSGFDDTTIRCFHGLLTASHLLALDLMLEALGDAKGWAWDPDWPGDARMGWIALPSGREHCFTKIQGSR